MNGVESSQWAINIEVNNLDDISKLTQRLQNITQTASKLRPQLVSAVTEINKLTQAGTATSVMSSWTTLESKVNDTRRLAIQARREVSELRRQVEKGGGGAGIHLNQMSGSIAQAVAKGVQEGFRNAQIGTSFKGFEPPKTQADSREFYNKKFGIPFETADAYRTGDRKGTVPPGGRFAPLSGGSELQMMQLASNLLRAVVTDPIVRAINTLPSQLGHKIESQRDKEVTPRSPAAQAAAGDSPPQREQRAHREVNPIPAVDDARFERNKIAYSAKQLGMTPQELQSLSRQQIAERAVHTLNVPATARPAASTNMDARQSIAHVLAAKENPNETFGDFALRAATFNVATRGNNAATKQVLAKNFEAARAVAGDTPAAALAANRRTVQQVASLDDIDKGKNRSAATAVAQRLRTYTEAGAGEATAERLATQDAPRIRRAKNYAAGFGTPFRNDTIPSMAGTGEQREAIGSRLDPHLYDVHEKHIKPAIASGQLDPRSANSYYKFFLDKAIEEGVPGTHDLVGPRGGIKNSREGNTFKKQAALYRDIAIDSLKTPVAAQVAAAPIVVPPVPTPTPVPAAVVNPASDPVTRLQEAMREDSRRRYGPTHFSGATVAEHVQEKARLRVVYPQNYEHENIGASANAEEAYSRIARKHSVPIANVKSMVSGDLLSQANIAALSDADWKVYKKVVQDILVHAKKLDLAIAEQARTLGAPAVIRSFAIRNKPYPNVMQSAFPVGAELITPADVLAGPHREISSVRAPGSMGDRKASLGTRWLDAGVRAAMYGSAATVLYGGVASAGNAVATMGNYDEQINKIRKVMNPLSGDIKVVSEAAKQMGKEFGVSVIDSASAMQMYASMGKNASAIIGESRVAILATNVSTLTLKSAVESLTSTSKQFNIPASDTIRILDSWSKIGATTAVDAERMAKAFSTAGAVAKASGLNFDETTGIISAMGEATMKSGEELGTGLKEILTNIRTPQAIESLQAIGVFMQDANGKLLSSRDALAQVKSRWNDLTDAQRQNIAVQIAGTRHAGDFFVLMQKWERAVDLTASSMLSQGTAMKQNDVVMESLNKKLQQLEASWQSFIVSIGETGAIDGLKHILEFTTKIVDGFTTLDKLTHGVAGGIAGTMAATAAVGATAITYGGWDTISGVAHGAANGIRPGGGRPGGGGGAASKAVSAIASSSGELESLAAMAGMGILQNQTTGHKTVASAIRAKNIEAALQLHQSGAPFGAGLNSPQDMELLALFNRARSRTGTMPSSMPVGASLVAGAPDTAGVDELVPTPAPPDHTTRNRVVRQMGLGLGMMVAPMAINAAYDNYHPDDGHTYDPTRTKLKYATDLSANMGLATMLYHPGGGIKGNIPALIAGTVGAAKTASDWYGNYQEGSRRQSGEAGGTSKMAELDALTEKIQSTSSDLHDTLEAISNGQAIDPQKLNELRDRLSALSPEFAKISQNSTDLFSALKAGGPVLAKAQELARSEKVSLITSKLSETIGSTDTQKKIEERSKLMVEMTTAQSPGQRMDAQVRLAGVRGDLGASYRGLQAVAGVSGAAGVGSKGVVDTGLIGSVAKLNQMSASDVASSFLGNMVKGMKGGGEIDVKKALGGADAEKALKEGYVQLQEEGPIFRLYDQAEVAHYADEVKKTAADIKAAGGILLKAGDQLKGVPIANPEALASIIGNVTQTANALVNRNNQIMQQTEFISKNILVAARAAQGGDVYGGMGVRATRQSLESFSQIQTKGYAGTTPITIDPNNLRTISEALKDMSGGILRNSTNPNGTSIQGLLSLRSNLFSTMVTGQNMVQRQVGAYIKGGGKNFDSFTQEAGASYAPVAEWLQKQLSSKDGPGSFADFQSIINKAQTARHEGRNDDAAKLEDSALNVAIDKIGLGTRDAIPKLGMEIQKQLGQMGMLSQQAVESLGKEFAFQRDSGKVSNVGEYMASPEVQQVVSTLSGFKDMAGRNLKTERGQLSNLRAAGADNREISEAENTVRELESTFKLLDATLSDLPDRVHMFQAGLRDLSNEMGRMQAGASFGGNSGLTGLSAQQFSVDKLQGAINDLSQRMASGKLSPDAGTQAIQQLSHTMIDVRNAMEITRMQRESLDRGAVQSSVTGSVFARLSIPGSNGAGDFITSKQQQIAESVEKLIHMADGRLSGDGQIKRFTDELVRKLAPALGGVNKSVLALDPGFRKNFLLANPSEQLLTSTLMDQMKKGASAQDIFGHPMLREAARNSPLISEVMDQFIKSDTESPQRIVELQTEMLGYQKSLPEIAAKMSEFLDKINPPAAAATAPKMSSGSMAMAGKSSAVDSKGRINKDGTMAVLHEGEIVLNKRQSQELLANHFASGTAPGKRFDSILGVGTESRKFTGTTSEVVGVEMARQDFLRRAWGMGLDHRALDLVSKNYKVGGPDTGAHSEVNLGQAVSSKGKVRYAVEPTTTHIATSGGSRFMSGVIGEEAFHLLDRQHLESVPESVLGGLSGEQVHHIQEVFHLLGNHKDKRVQLARKVVAERYPKFKDAYWDSPEGFLENKKPSTATMAEMNSEVMGKLLQMSIADNKPIPKNVLDVMSQYTRTGGEMESAVRQGISLGRYRKMVDQSTRDLKYSAQHDGDYFEHSKNMVELFGMPEKSFGPKPLSKDMEMRWWESLRIKNAYDYAPDSTKNTLGKYTPTGGDITEGRVNTSPFGVGSWLDDPELAMLPKRAKTPSIRPLAKGMARFYHGGDPDNKGARWFSSQPEYAQGYADKTIGAKVFYIDLPENHPLLSKAFDDTGTSVVAPFNSFEAPAEIAQRAKVWTPPSKKTAAGVAAILAETKAHNAAFARGTNTTSGLSVGGTLNESFTSAGSVATGTIEQPPKPRRVARRYTASNPTPSARDVLSERLVEGVRVSPTPAPMPATLPKTPYTYNIQSVEEPTLMSDRLLESAQIDASNRAAIMLKAKQVAGVIPADQVHDMWSNRLMPGETPGVGNPMPISRPRPVFPAKSPDPLVHDVWSSRLYENAQRDAVVNARNAKARAQKAAELRARREAARKGNVAAVESFTPTEPGFGDPSNITVRDAMSERAFTNLSTSQITEGWNAAARAKVEAAENAAYAKVEAARAPRLEVPIAPPIDEASAAHEAWVNRMMGEDRGPTSYYTRLANQQKWEKQNAKLERGTRVKRAQAGLDYDNLNERAAGQYSRYGGYDPGVTPGPRPVNYTPVGSELPFDYYNPAYGKAMPKSRAASHLSIPWQSKLPMWMRNSGYAVGESWAKTRKPFKMAVGGAAGLGVGLAITELALPMAARATLGQTGEDAYHGGVRPMLNHAMQAQFYGHLAKGGGLLTEQLETKALGDAILRKAVERESAALAAKAGLAEATPEMAQQALAKVGMVRRGIYGFGNVTSELMAGKGFAERAIPSLGGYLTPKVAVNPLTMEATTMVGGFAEKSLMGRGLAKLGASRSIGGLASPMMAMTVASLVAKTPEYVRKIGGYWNKDWARDDTYGADATRFGEAAGNIISAPMDLAMHYATLGYVGEGLHVGNYKEVVGQHKDELNKLEGSNWADRTIQGFMDTGAAFGRSGDETAGAALLTYHQSLRMDADTSTSQTMNELFNKPFLMSVTPQKFEELYPSTGGGTATVDPLADRIAKIDDTLKVLNPDTSKGGGGLINSLKASLDRSRGTLGESDVASARKQIEELESKREKLTKMKSFLLTKSHEGLGRYGNYKSKADMFLLSESLKSNPHAYSVLMDAAARHSFFDVSRVLTDAGDDRGKALLKDQGALQSWRQLAISDPTQTIGDMVQAVSASIGKSQQENILDTSKHGKDAQWIRYFSASNISKAALESSKKNAFQSVDSDQETSGFIATALDSVSQFLPLITDDKGPYKTYVSDYHRAEEHMAAVVAQAHGGVLDYGPYSTGVDPNIILKAAGSYGYLKSSIDQDVAKTSTEHDAARKALEGVYLGYTSLPESDRGVVTRRLVEGGVLSDPNKEIKSVKDIVDVWPNITDLTQGDGMMQVTGWDKKAREDYDKWSQVAEMRTAVNEAKQKARYNVAQSDQQKSLYSAMQATGANYDSVVITNGGTQSFSDKLKISKSGDQDGSLRYQNDLLQYRAQLDYYNSLLGTPLAVTTDGVNNPSMVDANGAIRNDNTPTLLHKGEKVVRSADAASIRNAQAILKAKEEGTFKKEEDPYFKKMSVRPAATTYVKPTAAPSNPADIFLQSKFQKAQDILENSGKVVPHAAAVAATSDNRTTAQKFDGQEKAGAEYAKTLAMSPQELWKSQVEGAGKFGIKEDELLHDQLEKKASAAAGKQVSIPMVKGLHRSWSAPDEKGNTKEMYEFEKNGKKVWTEAGKAFQPLPTKNADGTQNLDNIETNNSLSGVGVLPKLDDGGRAFGTAATAAGQAASKSEALKVTNPGRESVDREPLVKSAYATSESPNADSLHADMQALITELRNEHGGSGGSMTHSGEVTLKVGDDVQAFLKQLTAIVNGGNTKTPQVGDIVPKPNTQTQ